MKFITKRRKKKKKKRGGGTPKTLLCVWPSISEPGRRADHPLNESTRGSGLNQRDEATHAAFPLKHLPTRRGGNGRPGLWHAAGASGGGAGGRGGGCGVACVREQGETTPHPAGDIKSSHQGLTTTRTSKSTRAREEHHDHERARSITITHHTRPTAAWGSRRRGGRPLPSSPSSRPSPSSPSSQPSPSSPSSRRTAPSPSSPSSSSAVVTVAVVAQRSLQEPVVEDRLSFGPASSPSHHRHRRHHCRSPS